MKVVLQANSQQIKQIFKLKVPTVPEQKSKSRNIQTHSQFDRA